MWVREALNVATPVGPGPAFTSFDLLGNFRGVMGISLNLPDIVIWRIHIKVSIRFTLAPSTAIQANDSVLFSLFVDTSNQTLLNPVTQPYSEKFMMFDNLYASSLVQQGLTVAASLPGDLLMFKEYDIKSHRRIANLDETLWMTLSPQGTDLTILNWSATHSTLVKLP